MKKYHLADLFTLLEVILACTLLIMAFLGTPADYALWVFVAGELCDAFDGPCARRWHYPNDGKYRWWRRYNVEIDQISDIMLAFACGIYLIWRVSVSFGCILLFGIGAYCLITQLYLYEFNRISHRFIPRRTISAAERHSHVIVRRLIYAIMGIGGAIVLLISATSWEFRTKIIVCALGAIIALPVLLIFKRPRTKSERTPL